MLCGRLDESGRHARRALEVSRRLEELRGTLYSLAACARVAAAEGDHARAARLWGAIEGAETRQAVPQWQAERDELGAQVLAVDTPETQAARAEGRSLSLDEAVELALS